MKRIILILSLATLLTSCSIYKKYSRPEDISTDKLYGNIENGDTTTIADISWREFFKDKYLQGYIEQGLKNNIDMRLAAERVSQAELSLQSAKLAFIPTFGFEPSFTTKTNSSQFAYTLPVKASWEIDIMARQINAKRRAEASLEYNKLYRRSTQTALVSAIANNYYTLLMLDAQLRISRSTAATWKENVRIMKAMKQAGMTNAASISQTEANSCSIDASLHDLEFKLIQAQNSFALLLGVTPQDFPRGKLNNTDFMHDLFVGVPAQLLSRRPDVQQAEYELQLAFYNTNIARAALYPTITLTGEGGLTNPAKFFLSLVGKLTQPIFNAGRNRANLKISESQQREAVMHFEHKLLEAGNEVNTALAQCRTARNKTNLRIRQIETLKSAVYSTRQLMSHSEATYLEVLTAQQSLLSARLQQVSDHIEGIQGVIKLYRALGGGVDTSIEPATEKNPIFKCNRKNK